jgi:hypothetical protein
VGINTKFEKMASKTSGVITITWTANEPTAGVAQTIADGASPTVAETGQAIQNLTTMLNKVVADVESLRSKMNAGEGS